MADVARGSVLLTPRFDNLTGSIESQLGGAFSKTSAIGAKAGADTGKKYSDGLSAKAGALAGVVSSLTTKAFDGIASSLGNAISRVDTMNNYPKVMQNLGYLGDEATASIKRMSAAIDGLPTSLPALTGMVQQLAPLCGSLDEATTIGIAFNDMCLASGASAADVSRAMAQYSQILSKGVPDLQDWKTLQEVMPGQLNQIAKSLLGTSASSKDLYSALKDGKVSMDDFNQAMVSLDTEGVDGFASFAQQAKDATQGIGTALDNVPNRASKAIQSVVDAFGASNISGAINAFSSSFVGTGAAIATVVYGIKAVVGLAVDNMTSLFQGLQSALPQGFIDGMVSALGQLAPAIAPAVTAFALLLPVMAGLKGVIGIVSGFSSLGSVLMAVAGGPVGLIIAAVAAVVVGLAALYNTNETVRSAIDSAWAQIQALAAQVWPIIQQVISNAMQIIQQVVAVAWPVIQQVVSNSMNTIMAVVSAVWPVIEAIITAAMNIINAVISTVLAAINGDWGGVWQGIQAIASAVWSGIQSIVGAAINAVASIIRSILASISSAWSSAWNGIKSFFSSIWNGIKSGATNGINAVLDVVRGIKDKITGFFSGAGSWLVDSGRSILEGLKNGIMSAVGDVANTVSGAVGQIRGLFPFSPAKWGPFSGHGYTTYSGKALMGDFGESIADAAGGTASVAAKAMGTVYDALSAKPVEFSATASVGSVRAAAARAAVDADSIGDDSADAVIEWLGRNLPSIIAEFTPVMGESDFGRKVRKAVTYA